MRALEAKANDVAILQFATLNLLSADEKAVAVPPVFQIISPPLGNNRRGLAGDAAVVKLKVISGYSAAPD